MNVVECCGGEFKHKNCCILGNERLYKLYKDINKNVYIKYMPNLGFGAIQNCDYLIFIIYGVILNYCFLCFLWTVSMMLSMLGITMQLKRCSWLALYCCCINFANSRISDESRSQIFNPFFFALIAVIMPYMQNPQPMTPPWNYIFSTSMIFSMLGLMMRLKWCAWVALYCSCISFANTRLSDDTKQILSSFMLSISAVVMSYLQNPQPMTPPWGSLSGGSSAVETQAPTVAPPS